MITFNIEPIPSDLNELKSLFVDHWDELALNKDKVPLDPIYEIYYQKEISGELFFVAAREEGRIVGYYVGFVSPGLHYRTCLTCLTDIFYIKKEYRGGTLGLKMFRFLEKELIKRGVKRWFMNSKVDHDASPLFERIGAHKVETYYSKWLGE